MNDSHKILKIISVSIAIAFSDGTLANARNVSALNQPKIFKFQEIVAQSPPSETSSPVESNSEGTNIEYLDPSANPLLFPTRPEEVEIDVTQPITLEQAIELAIRNNKDLQEVRLNLERSLLELREAEAAWYPNLELGLDLSNSDSPGAQRQLELARQRNGFLTDEDTTTTSFTGSVELNYNLYTGGRRGADIRRATRQVRLGELQVEQLTEQTRFAATRDYLILQNTGAQVEIEQAAVEDATQTLRDARLLEQAGLGTRFDVLQAEVALADAQQRLTRAEADRQTASRQLAQTLSLGPRVGISARDEIAEAGIWNLTLEETIVLAFKNRAELEQNLIQREINEQLRQIALSEIRPQLSAFANYQFLDQFNDDIGITDGYSVGARVQLRIFDGGAAIARAQQREKDIEINETQFANQRNQIRLEVEQAYFDLQANQNNIKTAQIAVQQAEESLRLARLRFQAGVGTQTDVIQAQTDLTTARGNLLAAVIQYNQSLNQLQRAVTNLPEGRLFDLP
ncbi:TolC family protein [Pleurocapsales cyanobacterium LEGE 06147]|nr:TolC family protein [Pleurocapsales cyanobacterium LEGE 06147]